MFNVAESDLMNKQPVDSDLIAVTRNINPARIESYSETIPLNDYREDNKCWTSVVMFSGHDFIVDMTVIEFEKLLNNAK